MSGILDQKKNFEGQYGYGYGGDGAKNISGDVRNDIDCSHLVFEMLRGAGYKFTESGKDYRSTSEMRGSGFYDEIPEGDVRPGDIALWTTGGIKHTGIVEVPYDEINGGRFFGSQSSTGPASTDFGVPGKYWPKPTVYLRPKPEYSPPVGNGSNNGGSSGGDSGSNNGGSNGGDGSSNNGSGQPGNNTGSGQGYILPTPGYVIWFQDPNKHYPTAIGTLIPGLKSTFKQAEITRSPLILDIDGDGVETLSKEAGAYFDHDGNGFAELTGWVGKDDGLLVWDRNQNGQIDNGGELFGNYTRLGNGQSAANGFAALADLDSNHDGKIDASDAAFIQLSVWKDSNSNAVVDDDELLSLSQANVGSLSTTFVNQNKTDANGNQALQAGGYTDANGVSHSMSDIWFGVDTAYTQDLNTVELSSEVYYLPDAMGFGKVPGLQQAMERDSSGKLMALVKSFVSETDATIRAQILTSLIYTWAGVDGVDPKSRAASQIYGNVIGDARKLATLEKFLGESYLGTWCWGARDPNPHGRAAPFLLQAFDQLASFISSQLMAQTHFKELYDGVQFEWHSQTLSYTLDVSALVAKLQAHYTDDAVDGSRLLRGFINNQQAMGAAGADVIEALRNRGDLNAQGFLFELATLDRFVLRGDSSDNVLNGQIGRDSIFIGYGGSDTLNGSQAADTYVFNLGDGKDVINEAGGVDAVRFGAGITASDMQIFKVGSDLMFAHSNGSDQITVKDAFNDYGSVLATRIIEQIRFADGSAWNWDDIATGTLGGGVISNGSDEGDLLQGTSISDRINSRAGDDKLYGGAGNDQLSGGEGNDTLFGESGNDILSGGAGDDLLIGGAGDNIYQFGVGGGHDRIQTPQWVTLGNDVLLLEVGLVPADVYLSRAGNDLLVVLTATGDSVTVESYFNSTNVGIRSIAFADGTSWNRAAIDQLSLIGNDNDNLLQGFYGRDDLILGNGGNDKLYGFGGNDTLDGGAGDDLLDGSIGDDVYRFGRGAGHDVIKDLLGTADRIELSADVLPEDVLVRRVGADLVLTIRDSGDTLFVQGGLPSDNSALAIEAVQFANGTVWGAAALRQLALAGTAGADRLEGSNAADLVDGLAGNDLLLGLGGNDTYAFGVGDGQDSIEDQSGTDIVQFKAGVDAAGVNYAVDGNDLLVTLQGSADSLRLKDWQYSSVQNLRFFDGTLVSRANIQALLGLGSDYEVIYGTADADIITGSKAESAVYGHAGDDVISGGAGRDWLHGEEGNDSLDGGVDDDYLLGGTGDDMLDGGAGRDYLVGESGNNRYLLNYGTGLDQIQVSMGGVASDTVVFGTGITLDQVSVQFGDQSYMSGAGTLGYRQMVVGIGGDDAFSIQVSDWNSDLGLGSVRYFEFADGTVLTLEEMAARADNGLAGYQSDYYGSSSLIGSNADDWIYAHTGDDVVQARGNNDYVSGGSGDDVLSGGSGRDTLDGADGDDLLAGEVGDDRLYGGQGDDVFVFNLGDGHDTIQDFSPNGAAVDTLSLGKGINLTNLSAYVDGGSLHLLVAGGADNSITLSGFIDSLEPDAASGLPTRLQIVGGDGRVQIFDLHAWASAHAGALLASSASLPVDLAGSLSSYDLTGTVAPAGGYRAIAYGQTSNLFGVASFASGNLASDANDVLMGTFGKDSLAGLGGNDVIVGDADDDLLDGGSGSDVIAGGSGDDMLIGGSGNDKLYGGSGSDFLDAGAGRDYAAGGRGGDVYSYFASNGYLTIEDDHLSQHDGEYGGEYEVEYGGEYEVEDGEYGSTVDLDPNILQFGPGIRYEDLKFSEENGDLIITTGTAGDRLRLVGYDPTRATFSRSIDQFRFADGVVVEAQPGDDANVLLGSDDDDWLGGDNSNDVISGGAGNDEIEAGSGNDHLIGGEGNDTYLFNLWDTGIKLIDDLSLPAAENHILFGDDMSADSIDFVGYGELGLEVRFYNDLVLRFPGFDRYQEDMPPPVADFIFSDGSSLSFSDVLAMGAIGAAITPLEITGTPDSDLLYGTDGADHIRGLGSDDILVGGAGDDVYFIGENDGNDTIIDAAIPGASNTVVLLDVDPDSLTLSYDPDSGELIINSPGSENVLRLSGFDPNDPFGSHAVELFDFGSVVLSYEELLERGFDIVGTDDSDYLPGTVVDDRISGGDGGDVIVGGAGDDELSGGAADDAYVFNLGDGLDVINDTADGNIIAFTEGVTLQDVSFSIDGDVLTVSYGNLGDAIQVLNFAPNGKQGPLAVSQIVFSDGSTYSLQGLLNTAPELAAPLADVSSNEDAVFSYTVSASTFTDVDLGDTLSYSATLADGAALPSWLSFDTATRTFSGTPLDGDVGVTDITITATDLAGASVSDVFSITVNNTADAPVVSLPLTDADINEDAVFSYTVPASTFTDADLGDTLSYSAKLANGDALPSWLSFDTATRTFSGTPLNGHVGVVDIVVIATDVAGASVSDVFSVTVNNTTDAPVVSLPLADVSSSEDAAFSYTVPASTFTDADLGDTLSYSATLANGAALPSWLSFDTATRTFSGTPLNGDVGVIDVVITATDLSGATASDVFSVTVNNTADAPVISLPLADASSSEDAVFIYTVPASTFTDADLCDTLSYSAKLANSAVLVAADRKLTQ